MLRKALAIHQPKLAHARSPAEELLIEPFERYRLPLPGRLSVLVAGLLVAVLWRLALLVVPGRGQAWLVACAFGTSGLYWLVALLAALGRPPIALGRMAAKELGALTMSPLSPPLTLGVAGLLIALTARLEGYKQLSDGLVRVVRLKFK